MHCSAPWLRELRDLEAAHLLRPCLQISAHRRHHSHHHHNNRDNDVDDGGDDDDGDDGVDYGDDDDTSDREKAKNKKNQTMFGELRVYVKVVDQKRRFCCSVWGVGNVAPQAQSTQTTAQARPKPQRQPQRQATLERGRVHRRRPMLPNAFSQSNSRKKSHRVHSPPVRPVYKQTGV